MICADGKWDWTRLEGTGLEGVADRIDKLTPNSYSGYDEKEVIYMPTSYPSCDWLAIYDPNPADSRYGKWYKGDNYYDEYHNVGEYWGDVNDLFGVGDVITKWSNGASHKRTSTTSSTFTATDIGIEILSKNSNSSYTITVRTTQPEQLSPSKPQAVSASLDARCRGNIQWNANTEPDISGYNVYRQLYYGSTTLSEVLVASNITGTTYTDNIVIPSNTPSGVNLYVRYKVEAVDNQAKVSVKAIGNSILLGTTSSVSGTISSNTVWSGGVKLVTGNLTVNSGRTLTINSNTYLCFASGAALQVNGYINAANTSFQGLGGSFWYGITVNGLPYSSFTNCSIRDAQFGLIVDGASTASPTVTNCNISASTIGVWIKTYGDPRISNCYIKSSGSSVILSSNNAAGRISRCSLTGAATHGHKNDNSATTSYNNSGRNLIQGTFFPGDGYSIYVTGGYPAFNDGYNSIPPKGGFPQYFNATGILREAINNYWGGSNPYFSGLLTYSPYLTSSPSPLGPDWTLSKINNDGTEVVSDDPLALAWKAFGDNDFNRAIELAKTVFNNNANSRSADNKLQPEALFLWMKAAMFNGDLLKSENTLKSLNSSKHYTQSANYEAVRWLAKSAVINDNIRLAEEYALSIPSESPYCKEILFDAAVETIERWGSLEKAQIFFDRLAELYSDKETAKEIALVKEIYGSYLKMSVEKSANPYVESKTTEVPVSMNMFDAYPNPFNPTTTIAYSLTEAAKVNITIYDILGSEVTTLVDDVKEMGYYTSSFNASNLASGLYFARITINSQNQQPFIKTIKMMLTK